MRRQLCSSFAGLMVILVVVVPVSAPAATVNDRVLWATGYVARAQNPDGTFPSSFGGPVAATADAVASLVASRRGAGQVEKALDYLEANVALVDNPGKRAKVVMAAVAGGRNPQDFGGVDLIAALEATEEQDGRFLSSPFSQVYDQSLIILALEGAGRDVSRAAVMWLARAQCRDGGWQFDQGSQPGDDRKCKSTTDPASDFNESDTNTTSLAVQALASSARSVPLDADPFRFFRVLRDRIKGGWGFNRTFSLTDTVSTSLVLQAYAAAHESLPSGARGVLIGLQRSCSNADGVFPTGWEKKPGTKEYRKVGRDLGATVAAIPALLRKPFPIKPVAYLRNGPAAC